MGKSLKNHLADRNKFSPKKVRQPIHEFSPKNADMSKYCPNHEAGAHRKCVGKGCKHVDLKQQLKGTPARAVVSAKSRTFAATFE